MHRHHKNIHLIVKYILGGQRAHRELFLWSFYDATKKIIEILDFESIKDNCFCKYCIPTLYKYILGDKIYFRGVRGPQGNCLWGNLMVEQLQHWEIFDLKASRLMVVPENSELGPDKPK